MLKIKQYLCKHDFYMIAKHKIVSKDLYQCSKCGVYMVKHRGDLTSFKCKEFPLCGQWEFLD